MYCIHSIVRRVHYSNGISEVRICACTTWLILTIEITVEDCKNPTADHAVNDAFLPWTVMLETLESKLKVVVCEAISHLTSYLG